MPKGTIVVRLKVDRCPGAQGCQHRRQRHRGLWHHHRPHKSILTGYVSSKSNILDYSFKKADYGVVTKKSNTQLNDYVDGLISKWKEDGSLQKTHAVVNEAVESIAKIGRGQFRSFANAILRRFLREREKLEASCKKDDVATTQIGRASCRERV